MTDNVLLQQARAQRPVDEDTAACWRLIIRGVEVGWLDTDDMKEILSQANRGIDFGSEELFLESVDTLLRVRFLDEVYFCDPQEIIRLLQMVTQNSG